MATRKKIIVILGMHRSGTSILSRSMRVFGASLGDHLMEPQPCNPKGFFEDLDIYELNEKLLSHIGQHWYSLSPILKKGFSDLVGSYQNDAIKLLRQKLEKENIFSFKDPRTAILLPFWQSVFRNLRTPVSYFTIIRNPISVALSLRERDNFPIERSILLWTKYNLSILRNTRGKNTSFVLFDDLAVYPKNTIQSLSSFTSLPISQKELDLFLNDFLDPNIIHQKNDSNYTEELQKTPDKTKDLYQILLEISKLQDSKSYQSKIKRIEDWYISMNYPLQLLDKIF